MSDHTTPHALDEHEHHGPSLAFLAVIFVTLMLLTWLTVAVTSVDLGPSLNLTVALTIALIKATLVGLFFMHLWWDPPVFGFIIVSALGFVTLFIIFTLLDTSEVLPVIQARATQATTGG